MLSIRSIIFSLFILLLFSCSSKQEKTKPTEQNITESVYASGVVKSRNQYQVFSTVNGLIQNITVTEGDVVHKGQPILTLVNEASRLSAENAALAATYESVAANRDKLNELKINIDLAQSKMQNDSLLLQRQQNLWTQQIGTRNELEQRQLAYQNSVTAYKAAVMRYNDLRKQLSFSAQQSRKTLQISNTALSDYMIRSKIDGKVYSVLKEPGEMVNVQTPIAIIGDASNFYLELQVDEYDIGKIKLGQKVVVGMDSYKEQVYEAVIDKIDPIMDERSRSFTVEASFVTRPQNLYPNLTAEANIIIQTKEHVLTIPRNFLVNDSTVLLEDKKQRHVITGIKDYQKAEIISGLQKDEAIVKPTQ